MKTPTILLLLILLLVIAVPSNSQTTFWKWGTSHCVISKAADSTFLVDATKKMWKEASENNSFAVFEGFGGGYGYNIRVSKFGMEHAYADTSIAKLNFTSFAELLSLWNTTADTCWIIGFEPLVVFERNHRHAQEKDWKYMGSYTHIPLFRYMNFLEREQAVRLHNLMLISFANDFGAIRKGDTLFRNVAFHDDTNQFLPQATYKHMAQMMKNGLLAGDLYGYKMCTLGQPMYKRQLEESFVHWDSTNTVADPYGSGEFIIVPIKVEEQAVGVVIYEKWTPELCAEENIDKYPYYRPQPYLRYAREVVSYGLRLSSGSIIWTSPTQFDKLFQLPKFNREPYEQSFRAERFETMHIALEP